MTGASLSTVSPKDDKVMLSTVRKEKERERERE